VKLYFSPGTCSLSPHIALREAGLSFDLERVDFATLRTQSGVDFAIINPKAYVPVLELDNGERLTEGAAIVQYIGDQSPETKLAPPAGTLERYRLQEWLNFIAMELHKVYAPLFDAEAPEATRQRAKANLSRRLDFIQGALGSRPFLMGETFTVADCYLFTMLTWMKPAGLDPAAWPTLGAYFKRVIARPAVKAAIHFEKETFQAS
jgi:glutathione S-transferase